MPPDSGWDVTPSVTGTRPLPSPEPPPPLAPRSRRSLLRGPLVYYLLATFDVLTVSASLYLNHRIMQIYVRSVQANQAWAQRMSDYRELGELAAAVNAPGNDVFNSGDVSAEAVRLQRARLAFQARLAALRADLAQVPETEARPLRARMDEIEQAMNEMTAEASLIFSSFAAGQRSQAGQRMATMDRRYARVLATQRELGAAVSEVQQRQFARQTAAAANLQRFEYLIAALILLMVGAATVYGRKMSGLTSRDARERSAYVESLQAAEESLRKAHAHLEKRVQERTHALRESEAALRRAAQEWQRTFEAIDSPVMILDGEARALRLNPAAAALAGRALDGADGLSVAALGDGEPWARAAEVARRAREERAPATAEARDAGSGRTWEVAANLVPGEDGAGSERVIVVARDVTRLLELQESVRREERMSAMGSLVAGVAHEVRNPLFGISSTLDAFEARFGDTDAYQKYVTVLRGEADRLVVLMRDLLDYGKPPMLDVAEVDFEALVDEAARLCAPMAEARGVAIARVSRGPAGHVRLDRARMQQVLQNVIQNAIQHSPAGGAVEVGAGQDRDHDFPCVWASVRDFGPGFGPQDLPRLFEPFFTRRPGGTGLGLSIAQRIVSQHGGRLEARNHPQGGAVMVVKLPAAGPPPAAGA
jgi:PAS domain S-box-containing protein